MNYLGFPADWSVAKWDSKVGQKERKTRRKIAQGAAAE